MLTFSHSFAEYFAKIETHFLVHSIKFKRGKCNLQLNWSYTTYWFEVKSLYQKICYKWEFIGLLFLRFPNVFFLHGSDDINIKSEQINFRIYYINYNTIYFSQRVSYAKPSCFTFICRTLSQYENAEQMLEATRLHVIRIDYIWWHSMLASCCILASRTLPWPWSIMAILS